MSAALPEIDALVKDWYGSVPFPAGRARRGWIPLAASLLAAALLLPVLSGRRSESLAEEAVGRTAAALESVEGLLSRFTAVLEKGGRGSAGSGEIRFGKPCASPLLFRCEVSWPGRSLSWGQNAEILWTSEKEGDLRTASFISRPIDEGDLRDAASLYASLQAGSPAGVETRQAVEGLAALLRSFRRDSFRTWMGCAWEFRGGKGTARDPWLYRTEPFPEAKGDRIVWTLGISAGTDGRIEL